MAEDTPAKHLFISYARSDGESAAQRLQDLLESAGLSAWQDLRDIGSDETVWPQIETALKNAHQLVVLVTHGSIASEYVRREWREARRNGARVVPVLADGTIQRKNLPRWLRREEVYRLDLPERLEKFLAQVKMPKIGLRSQWQDGGFDTSAIVKRHQLTADIKRALLSDDGGPISLTSFIRGRGGYGKTLLASALCKDIEVRDAFIDGIFWQTVGRDDHNIDRALGDFIEGISGKAPTSSERGSLVNELARLIENRDVLLVIDDVWTQHQIRPFLTAATDASIIFTTRNTDLSSSDASQFDVSGLTDTEALSLISRNMAPDPDEQKLLAQLAKDLWHWPQLLAICNNAMWRRVRAGRKITDAIAQLRDNLGLIAARQTDDRDKTLVAAMEESLCTFSPDNRARFEKLVALPEDAGVSVTTLARLWDLPEYEAEDLCLDLGEANMLQPIKADAPVMLHDNMSFVLETILGQDALPAAHMAFIDAFRPSSGDWCDLDDPYMWEHLIWHLRKAGLGQDAEALLVTRDWLKARLEQTGAAGLFRAFVPSPQTPTAQVLGRSVGMSMPHLTKDPNQLDWMLAGRLANQKDPVLAAMSAKATNDMAPLRPVWHNLRPAGAEILRIDGHEDVVRSVAFSPDGRLVLSASDDNTLRLWDAQTGQSLRTFEGHRGSLMSIDFSPDGSRILSGSHDRTVRLWDVKTGNDLRNFIGHEEAINSVAFNPDGRCVLAGGYYGALCLWDTETGHLLHAFEQRGHSIGCVAFSPDGSKILSSNDNDLHLWDAKTGQNLRTFEGHEEWVTSVAFSPDGSRILSGSDDDTLRLWDTQTGQSLRIFEGQKAMVSSVAFSPDGSRFVSGGYDKTIRLWDAVAGKNQSMFEGHRSDIQSVAFSPDGSRILSGSDDWTLRLWDAQFLQSPRVVNEFYDKVTSLAVSPDGDHILCGTWDGVLQLWSAKTGQILRSYDGDEGGVDSVAFTLDGRGFLAGHESGTLHLWDVQTWQPRRSFKGSGNCVTFCPDGNSILTDSLNDDLRLLDAQTGQTIRTFEGHRRTINSIAFSPDGSHFVSGSDDNSLRLWNAQTGKCLRIMEGLWRSVESVDFSPDGTYIVSGSQGDILDLWDARTGQRLRTFEGHTASVHSVVFSPDGNRVLSGSFDGTVRVWDVWTGQLLQTLYFDANISCMSACEEVVAVGDSSGHLHCFGLLLR